MLEAFDRQKLDAKEHWLEGKCGCSMVHFSAQMEKKFSLRPLLIIEDDLVFVDPPTGFGAVRYRVWVGFAIRNPLLRSRFLLGRGNCLTGEGAFRVDEPPIPVREV